MKFLKILTYIILLNLISLPSTNIFANTEVNNEISNVSKDELNNKLNDYNYSKKILIDLNEDNYKEIILDGDIYRLSKNDISDIRLVDSKNNMVPYYIKKSSFYNEKNTMEFKSRNTNTFIKNSDVYYDYEVIPLVENVDIMANVLNFSVTNSNFAKSVTVYGSYDSINWKQVTKSNIYKVEGFSNTKIILSSTEKYTYYRLEVPNNLEKLNISNLELEYIKTKNFEDVYSKSKLLDFVIKTQNKISTITINNIDKLKIREIEIDANENFKRSYEVYKTENDKEIFTGIKGQIFNFEYQKTKIDRKKVNLNRTISSSEIILKIDNKDNKPINIKEITVKYNFDKLVFEAKKDESYKVYFGNINAKKPTYDIDSYKNYIEGEVYESCKLSSIKKLISEPIDEVPEKDYSFYTNAIIVLIAVALMIVIGTNLKKK